MEIKHNGAIYYSWMDEHVTFHQPTNFDTLTHVTSMENAEVILQEGLKMHLVGDYSCVNKLKDKRHSVHPLIKTSFLWMAPDTHDTTSAIRYGNVAFSLKNLVKLEKLNFYYVEFLDYVTKTAARIMITDKNYDHQFRRFDPTDEAQHGKNPVMFNGIEWVRFTSFSNSRNDEMLLDVEFLLDFIPLQKELNCSYVKCYDPKPIVTPYGKIRGSVRVFNGSMDVIRLIALLARYQGWNNYELRSNPFVTDLISAIQGIRSSDHFLPEHFIDDLLLMQEDGVCRKPDRLLTEIDFRRIFDEKEYSPNDWKCVQMLDLLFSHDSSVPNTQTIINILCKAVSDMKSERSVSDVLNLFFKCFLSGEAKRIVKKMLINMMCTL